MVWCFKVAGSPPDACRSRIYVHPALVQVLRILNAFFNIFYGV